jgi:hypothetical protein
MDDFDSDEYVERLVGRLRERAERERGRGLDCDEAPSSAEGALPDWWMCDSCGAFMSETARSCARCRTERP